MSSVLADRLFEGCQTPRVFTRPPAESYEAARQALEFVESVGVYLDPWQKFAVREALAEVSDGRWAAFEVLLLVARQNGKGEIMMALELAKLFLFRFRRVPLILHSAHLFPTAQEAFRRIREVIDGSDTLRREVRRVSAAHGEEGIELRDGARLRFMARTTGGAGRGFSPTDLMLDEVFWLPLEAVSANLPALSAQFNPQIFYTSSTGFPTSEVLLSLVRRGRAGDGSLTYMDWSAAPDADLDDPEAWSAANPAIGYRISETTIRRERAALPDAEFARERLGMWAEGGGGLFDPARWAELADGGSEPRSPFTYGLDVSADREWSTLAVAGYRPDGAVHVAVQHPARGTDWVIPYCVELSEKYPGSQVVLDSSGPVVSLLPGLRAAGLAVTELKSADLRKACGLLVDAVKQGTVRHRAQQVLTKAVEGAQSRPLGDGGFAFGRKASTTVDISPLNAACWAHYATVLAGPGDVSQEFA